MLCAFGGVDGPCISVPGVVSDDLAVPYTQNPQIAHAHLQAKVRFTAFVSSSVSYLASLPALETHIGV